MKAWLKKRFKNEEGFTLVELLAVIVILGIIAAIAVPSIGNVIENSKKDATVANAEQMIEASRLLVTSESPNFTDGSLTIPLKKANATTDGYGLIDNGYINSFEDTTGVDYDTASKVVVTKSADGALSYAVYLKGTEYEIEGEDEGSTVSESEIVRKKVKGSDN
ncbi:type II secretion system protein [Halobacillus salinus]|uniref:type II secretion system protein n=1 Tax=Halobacillus salinus TaxID=192814 RepID=UPI0009A74FE8|nr:type II secretion system protein [Halobacillus salinus]